MIKKIKYCFLTRFLQKLRPLDIALSSEQGRENEKGISGKFHSMGEQEDVIKTPAKFFERHRRGCIFQKGFLQEIANFRKRKKKNAYQVKEQDTYTNNRQIYLVRARYHYFFLENHSKQKEIQRVKVIQERILSPKEY